MTFGPTRRLVAFLFAMIAILLAPAGPVRDAGPVRFLGSAEIATGTMLGGTEVGGLSGLTQVGAQSYLAVSDDRHVPRIYRLQIDMSDGWLDKGDVRLNDVGFLRDSNGKAFDIRVDPEGIGVGPDGIIYVADEGYPRHGRPPLVRLFGDDLIGRGAHEPPDKVVPDGYRRRKSTRGARVNQGYESLAITPDGQRLVTATEQALLQDGPEAGRATGSRARIVTYDLENGEAGAEYVYEVAPLPSMVTLPGAPDRTGLVELLALDNDGALLALERSFSSLAGFGARLYRIDTAGATDVRRFDVLPQYARPVRKTELVDLARLSIGPDNLEGMAFGPRLADGSQVIILVSDNNFRPLQGTRFIALALDPAPRISPGLSTVAQQDVMPMPAQDLPPG